MSDDTIDITDLDPTGLLKLAKLLGKVFRLLREKTSDAELRKEYLQIEERLERIAEIREANEPLVNELTGIKELVDTASTANLKVLVGIRDRLDRLAPRETSRSAALVEYLEDLLDETSTLDIRGIGSRPGAQKEVWEPPPIEAIYTPLSTADRTVDGTEGKGHASMGAASKALISELLSQT